MSEDVEGELWALRPTADAAEVWTENGRLVAQFVDREIAEEAIEDHNIGVEMDRPPTPEEAKSSADRQTERLAEWRKFDPTGAYAADRLIECTARLCRLLALKAPRIIVVHSIEMICERAETLKAMYPPEIDQ